MNPFALRLATRGVLENDPLAVATQGYFISTPGELQDVVATLTVGAESLIRARAFNALWNEWVTPTNVEAHIPLELISQLERAAAIQAGILQTLPGLDISMFAEANAGLSYAASSHADAPKVNVYPIRVDADFVSGQEKASLISLETLIGLSVTDQLRIENLELVPKFVTQSTEFVSGVSEPATLDTELIENLETGLSTYAEHLISTLRLRSLSAEDTRGVFQAAIGKADYVASELAFGTLSAESLRKVRANSGFTVEQTVSLVQIASLVAEYKNALAEIAVLEGDFTSPISKNMGIGLEFLQPAQTSTTAYLEKLLGVDLSEVIWVEVRRPVLDGSIAPILTNGTVFGSQAGGLLIGILPNGQLIATVPAARLSGQVVGVLPDGRLITLTPGGDLRNVINTSTLNSSQFAGGIVVGDTPGGTTEEDS